MSESINYRMQQGIDKIRELDNLLKKVTIRYMCIVTCVFFIFTIFFWYQNLIPYPYLTAVCLVLHFILFFIPIRLEYSSTKLLIPIYLFTLSALLYPIVLFFWQVNQVTAFMWFFIFPVGVMVFFETKAVILWTTYILIEAISIFVLVDVIPYRPNVHLSTHQLSITNILTICSCLTLISFFIYYLNKTNQIRIGILQSTDNNKDEHGDTDTEKHHELYHNILNYFDNEKPYCDSDFSINQLADAMDTNITYISKAINTNESMNFNLFINTYRINMVKSMLSDDYQNKYTIRYIYTSSGFKHQSTFNKVFKQIEGITPSEYIRKMNKSKTNFHSEENIDTNQL